MNINIKKTNHSEKRIQQRSIQAKYLNLLLQLSSKYYSRHQAPGKAQKRIFSKKSLTLALHDKIITPAEFDKLKGICLIIKNDTLLTAYHLN